MEKGLRHPQADAVTTPVRKLYWANTRKIYLVEEMENFSIVTQVGIYGEI